VSNVAKLGAAIGWEPSTKVEDGVRRLAQWLQQARTGTFQAAHAQALP
jgi:nucleoside-diphosphate-sugar epimerase